MAETITIQVQRQAGTEDIALPEYMTAHASGMDIRAAVTEPMTINPGEVAKIPTGMYIAVPPGYEAQVRPRSGLALKSSILVVNSPGTIDADYRGEVGIILGNMGKTPFKISRGDRIAQLVIQRVERAQWEVVEKVPETSRNDGGFGSTGV